MKDIFFEFYQPIEIEIKEVWEKGIVTFDANVLLNFYRYSPKTQQELIRIISLLKDRIWLTHQAGLEYHRNRLTVIDKQKETYKKITDLLFDAEKELGNKLNEYKKHSLLEIESIKTNIKNAFDKVNSEINSIRDGHPDYEKDDNILNELTTLFNNNVGEPYDVKKLEQIYKEGAIRYEKLIPPGYKDLKNKKNDPPQNLYGDYIIWLQTIDASIKQNLPVIFVTDDNKEDWWERFNGKTISPRKELLREFKEKAGNKIFIYQPDKFLEAANTYLVPKEVSNDAIIEVRNTRINDEIDFIIKNNDLNYSFIQIKNLAEKFDPEGFNKFSKEVKEKLKANFQNINTEIIKPLPKFTISKEAMSAIVKNYNDLHSKYPNLSTNEIINLLEDMKNKLDEDEGREK